MSVLIALLQKERRCGNVKKRLALTAVLVLFIGLIATAGTVSEAVRHALLLCADTIVPSLFPFFVLSILLNRLGLPGLLGRVFGRAASALFGVSGEGVSALFIGLTGGYPLGASYIGELCVSGRIGRQEGERLLAFCNNSGPAFIIGAAGAGVFGSTGVGLLLYAVHVCAAVLTGMLFSGRGDETEERPPAQDDEAALATALPDAVKGAVTAVLNVCGFVVFFSAVTALMDAGGVLTACVQALATLLRADPAAIRALLVGILELGGGIAAMRGLPPTPGNLALAAFLLGFGSLSVHCQTAAVLDGTSLSMGHYLLAKALQGTFSMVLAWALSPLLF